MSNTTNICSYVSALLDYAEAKGLIGCGDRVYCANLIAADLGIAAFEDEKGALAGTTLPEILDGLLDYAVEAGIIDAGIAARDRFDTRLMGHLTARPSAVNARFEADLAVSPKQATDNFYKLAIDSNYIRADRIARDRRWSVPSPYGDIDISINLSKPEKDPRDIAAAKSAPQTGYPKCLLCPENVGYGGNAAGGPARQNLRQVPFTLGGEKWFLQYSPYVYYNEHCIVLSEAHTPMSIRHETFVRMLDFVDALPHYFVGSNADLPIVGGSILSHDHMQGGCYTFPMERAEIKVPLTFEGYPEISGGIVAWPMSVIRLRSASKESLVSLSDKILAAWREYTDESACVLAYTDGVPHNTITPIARRRGADFELDLVLRNNLCTEEFPMGVYHPHADKHNIKKENIGLIEVMGLAVLPARLEKEIALLADKVAAGATDAEIRADEVLSKHADWLAAFRDKYNFTADNAADLIRAEVGETFVHVLEDAGVYKDTEAMLRFTASVGAKA